MNTLKRFSERYGVLSMALVLLVVPILLIENDIIRHTNGVFSYPLDDTFIHMAIARNFAFYNVWGISSHEFASASSSILNTLLLAAFFKIFSANLLIPFLMNLLAAIVLLICLDYWLRKEAITKIARLLILVAVIFFTPLPVMVICGMEHTMQCLFAFLFVFYFCTWLDQKTVGVSSPWISWQVCAYGLLLTATRYEGLFLALPACLLLLYYRKFRATFKLAFFILLPVIVFGLYSLHKGGYFIPNTLLVKSRPLPLSWPALVSFGRALFYFLFYPYNGINVIAMQRLFFLLPAILILFYERLKQRPAYRHALLIIESAMLLHFCFASVISYCRYEAYLVCCSVILIGTLLAKFGRQVFFGKYKMAIWAASLVVVSFLVPIYNRSSGGFSMAKQACINIYEQQYQMGQFMHRYYDTSRLALNDIGAISYYTQGRKLDLVGLGSTEVVSHIRNRSMTIGYVDSLSKDWKITIAVVYDSWFSPNLFHNWTRVGTWQIPNNVICGDSIVSFYAVDNSYAKGLKKNLQTFQSALPTEVRVSYY